MIAPALATRLSRGLLGRECRGRARARAAFRMPASVRARWNLDSEWKLKTLEGENARSMKRQAASLERKLARIPSGKAGAEGGEEGAVS